MRRLALGFIAVLGIGAASAQTLYQCTSRAGNSYQQAPCAASTRLVRTLETQPDPPPTAEALAARARKTAEDRAESAFLSHAAGTDRWPSNYASRRGAGLRRQRGENPADTTVTIYADSAKSGRARIPRSLRRFRPGVLVPSPSG